MLLKLHRNPSGFGKMTKEYEVFVNPYDITTIEQSQYCGALIAFTSDRQITVMEGFKDVVKLIEDEIG